MLTLEKLKGRSLEETDELFDAGLRWGWQFSSYTTTGAGARIAAIENEDYEKIKELDVKSEHVENANDSRTSNEGITNEKASRN